MQKGHKGVGRSKRDRNPDTLTVGPSKASLALQHSPLLPRGGADTFDGSASGLGRAGVGLNVAAE